MKTCFVCGKPKKNEKLKEISLILPFPFCWDCAFKLHKKIIRKTKMAKKKKDKKVENKKTEE